MFGMAGEDLRRQARLKAGFAQNCIPMGSEGLRRKRNRGGALLQRPFVLRRFCACRLIQINEKLRAEHIRIVADMPL